MYKFFYFFTLQSSYNFIFVFIIFISLLDATLKLFGQVDLKKIVAVCTIFEMNIILFMLMFLTKSNYIFIILFSFLHAILSGLFFFIVECIYKRYNSRVLTNISNISNFYPMLSLNIIVSVFLFNGLPLTLKFNLELVFIYKLLTYNFLYFIIFFIIQIYFIVIFTKHFFSILFNHKKLKHTSDLNKKEIFIFLYFYSVLFLLSII